MANIKSRQTQDSSLRYLHIPLGGRLRTSVDGTELGEGDFQVLKNMRYGEISPQSIGGMTKINTSVIDATYIKPRSGFHYRKVQPSESHILVQAWNSGLTASCLYENTTAIPNQGNFIATALWTDNSGATIARISDAPDGSIAYCNGVDTCIWGGNEARCPGFVIGDLSTVFYDYTEKVNNTLSDSNNVALIKNNTIYIATIRPIKGIKFYISIANTSVGTAVVNQWYSSVWNNVTNLSDGTSLAGRTLAQTGSMTFDSTVSTAKPKILNNTFAYWYQVIVTGVDATTAVYYVTLNYPFQQIVDLWDGVARPIMSYFRFDGTTYNDESTNVLNEDYVSGNVLTYSDLSSLSTNSYLTVGFIERMTGMDLTLVTGKTNTNATNMSLYYWNGTTWTAVDNLSDGTKTGTKSLSKSGFITWDAPAESSEFRCAISDQNLWYYYKISFSAALSANVYLDLVTGIPAQKPIKGYLYPVMWQNRLWLLNDNSYMKNTAICSSLYTVCVFNGSDSTIILFGNEEGLVAGATLFMRYGGDMYDNLIVFKKNEVWLVDGTSPTDFKKFQISNKYGCVATGTLKSCDLGYEIAPGLTKHILIWQGQGAILMFDGNTVSPISDDIKNYFDPLRSECINSSLIGSSEAFYDELKCEYHWLFASGGSATSLNKEFVYNLKKKKWSEFPRSSGKQLQIGFSIKDTLGGSYQYGGIDTGYIERLENGTTFDGDTIVSEYRTGDIPLGGWTVETSIRHIKHIAVAKISTTNNVTITHYGDGSSSGSPDTVSASINASGKRIALKNESILWGNYIFHGFDCSLTTNNENIGYEPVGIGVYYLIIREDII